MLSYQLDLFHLTIYQSLSLCIFVLISFAYHQIADIYCLPLFKLRNNWHITLYKFMVYSVLI